MVVFLTKFSRIAPMQLSPVAAFDRVAGDVRRSFQSVDPMNSRHSRLMFSEPLAERVLRIPGRAFRYRRHLVTDSKNYLRTSARSGEIKRLVHIVLRSVVASGHPADSNLFSIESGIHGLEALAYGKRRYSLLNE